MGIPGLARLLQPYAGRYSAPQLDGFCAIIDGPSLAYHAHKLAVSASASQSRIPSYADINSEAIRWLTFLEGQSIKVSTILFDGALPELKRAERLSRTEQNNRRVQQLRASYPTTACPIPTYLGASSYAFLVPSLREALAESPFASRTQIVLGEADDSCALHAKDRPRSIIFTSDTDLLLYDYHPETLIVFFQDAELSAGLKAYSPHQTRQELRLKSLVPFAYTIQQRSSEGLEDLVRDARGIDVDAASYLDFSRRYSAPVVAPTYLAKPSSLPLPLQELDVRVSEFVHQALADSSRQLVHLPLLVEDPNQASAWNMAQDFRILAYTLLAPPGSIVHEYRRKAQCIFPQEINLCSTTDVGVLAKQMEGQLTTLLSWAKSKDISPFLLWSLFALSLVLVELNTPPPPLLVTRALNGDFDNTWAFIQLTARIHAAVYSLRMLKQIIAVRLAMDRQSSSKLHDCLTNLRNGMSSFPSIAEIFIVPGQRKRVLPEQERLRELVGEIYISVGIEVPTEQISNKKKKTKKRKAEQRQQSKTQISNAFALLKEEST